MIKKLLFATAFVSIAMIGIAGYLYFAKQKPALAQVVNNIYVDQALATDCLSGNYSIANRNCTGTDGNAYTTIQKAINTMSVGNTIYMRGGTYLVGKPGLPQAITIPFSKNGSAWTPGNYNTLTSYPGEWAIIDGQGVLGGASGSSGTVLGYYSYSRNGSADIKYWKFERFEVTGGVDRASPVAYGGGAIWVNGGPNIFRYLYIHDNLQTNDSMGGYNNPSGIVGTVWHDTIVEYNYFKNNACRSIAVGSDNCAHIAIYSDYQWTAPNVVDINHATRSNIVRYNLFDTSSRGFKDKGKQILTDTVTGADMTYKDKGDQIHHNIFFNHKQAIMHAQDFIQVFNNISDGGRITQEECGSKGGVCATLWRQMFYNNTVTNNVVNTNGAINFPTSYGEPPTVFHPKVWAVNNIVDSFVNQWDISSISAGALMATTGGTVEMTDSKIDRNFIYRPGSSTQLRIGRGAGACSDWMTVSSYNTCYSASNYANSTAGLYAGTTGADKYIANGNFTLSGSNTIANGGIGGSHPYLAGVTLPSYIGATNPNDNAWVAGVLSLANPITLQNGSSNDPSWIEGVNPPHPPLKGDFNSDQKVNDLDFTDFKNAFKSLFNSIFDLNSDSTIDVKDLGVLMNSWLP